MKAKIINIVKYSKPVYSAYYYVMNSLISGLKPFVKTDDKLILFNSYAGRKFDDSPKAIFDVMKKDIRFKDYKLVWAFHNPEMYEIEGAEKIRTDTFEYFKTALQAKVWITNSSVERGLHFKNKNTLYFNTWHGTPIKKMGNDIENNKGFKEKKQSDIDVMTVQGDFEASMFSNCFGIPADRFLKVGLPRNDQLASYSYKEREQFRNKLGISSNKKVILYCPTFREFERDQNNGCILVPPMNLGKWEKELGEEYVLLFRAHYEVAKAMEIKENSFVRDVTGYPSINELMIASDILLSDYSSILVDYSIMDKPMLHFTYDYDKYSLNRGMYFDIRNYLSGADHEDAVINLIKFMNCNAETEKTKVFRKQFVQYYGNASRLSVDYIFERLIQK